jgi:hypothetical protein
MVPGPFEPLPPARWTVMLATMNASMVDNHRVLREGVATLSKRARLDTIAAREGDVAGRLGLAVARTNLDVIVVDLMLPRVGGMRG